MKNWVRLACATALAAVLAACTSMGEPAHVGSDGTSTTPSTKSTVYAKDVLGLGLAGNNRQWVTMDMKSECKHFGDCTADEIANAKAHCDVARYAYGIPVSVPTVSSAALGGPVLALSVGAGSEAIKLPLKIVEKNGALDGITGLGEYALNGSQLGTSDSLQFDEKCANGKAGASGFVLLDVRFASGDSASVVHLRYDGTVKPITNVASIAGDEDEQLIDTAGMSPHDALVMRSCLTVFHREDPYGINKLNACLKQRGVTAFTVMPPGSDRSGVPAQTQSAVPAQAPAATEPPGYH